MIKIKIFKFDIGYPARTKDRALTKIIFKH